MPVRCSDRPLCHNVMHLIRNVATVFAFALASASQTMPLLAQNAPPAATNAIIRGTITGANGEPLRYVVVTLPATGQQQFTNQDGKFFFVQLRAGKHELSIRQLGYQPATRTVTVEAGATAEVSVQLRRIVMQLATIKVQDEWACDRPGRPMDKSARALLEVFEQLEQNAVRLQLMAKEYPFIWTAERKRAQLTAAGREEMIFVDSTRMESSPKPAYAPGNVLEKISKRRSAAEYNLRVPTLLDFADVKFQKNHCFQLRGVDSASSVARIRVDFKAWSKLKSPDVEGTVYLEAGTFRLLSTEIRLTKIPSDLEALTGVTATTKFEDITDGLPTVLSIMARSTYRTTGKNASPHPVSLEFQRTLSVAFLKSRPDGVPQPPLTLSLRDD